MHGPPWCVAGAFGVPVLEHLRRGGGGARVLSGDREAASRFLPGCDRCAGLQPRCLRQGLYGRPHGGPGRQQSGGERQLRQPCAQRFERQQRARALPRAAHQESAQFRAHAALHGRRSRRENVAAVHVDQDRKSTRLNCSHTVISYAVFCLKKKKQKKARRTRSTSSTFRTTSCAVTLMCNSTPFGSMMKVPRCAITSSWSTPTERISSRRLS